MTTPRALPLPARDPDDIPTRAQLDREEYDAARTPPIPQARRHGHPAVARYVSPPESLVHLGFDGGTTLCGQPWDERVARAGWPTCGACVGAVES